jgi:hypothetical protein
MNAPIASGQSVRQGFSFKSEPRGIKSTCGFYLTLSETKPPLSI